MYNKAILAGVLAMVSGLEIAYIQRCRIASGRRFRPTYSRRRISFPGAFPGSRVEFPPSGVIIILMCTVGVLGSGD